MDTNFIDLDKIQVPESQVKNFNFIKGFCQTFQLNVNKIIFDDPSYAIILHCFANDKTYKFCFNFENGIPLVCLKEVEDANK